MAGRKQIYLEMRDDIPARFVDAYDKAGKAGNKRTLVVECLSVGFAIKELDPRLFRMIQASMESGGISIDELSIYLETCRKLAKQDTPQDDDFEPVVETKPEPPAKKSDAASMIGFMQ